MSHRYRSEQVVHTSKSQNGHLTRAWFDLLNDSQHTTQDMSLAFYRRFLFKWGVFDPDLDTVLGDDNGRLGRGPDG